MFHPPGSTITRPARRCCWRRWDQTSLAARTLRAGTAFLSGCPPHLCSVSGFHTAPAPCRTPLHAAAFAGHVDCIQLLLSHDAPVDAVDQSGRTALMMAAEKGRGGALGTETVCWCEMGAWCTDLKKTIYTDQQVDYCVLLWPINAIRSQNSLCCKQFKVKFVEFRGIC